MSESQTGDVIVSRPCPTLRLITIGGRSGLVFHHCLQLCLDTPLFMPRGDDRICVLHPRLPGTAYAQYYRCDLDGS